MTDMYSGSSTYSGGNPPPPPPKPYSQDQSRSNTPVGIANNRQPDSNRFSQHYSQPPASQHPPQQPYSPPPNQQPFHPQTFQQPHSDNQYGHMSPHPPGQEQPANPFLPVTFELPESIKKQTTADLAKLLSEPELLNSLAQLHPAYDSALQPLQNQLSLNTSLAAQVSSLETQIKGLREQTGQLMLQHTSLQTQWRRKQAEMDEALAPWGPRAMYQRLLAGISEQEQMLIAVQESFLEGAGDAQDYHNGTGGKATEKEVTDWVKRIREGASVLEKRREMRARWDEGRVGGWR